MRGGDAGVERAPGEGGVSGQRRAFGFESAPADEAVVSALMMEREGCWVGVVSLRVQSWS